MLVQRPALRLLRGLKAATGFPGLPDPLPPLCPLYQRTERHAAAVVHGRLHRRSKLDFGTEELPGTSSRHEATLRPGRKGRRDL